VSLRARLLMLVLLATLLPALLMGWRFMRDREVEIASAVKALSAAADRIAEDLDQRVQGTAQLHYGLAYASILQTEDRVACSAYLSAVREAYPQYTGIITVLPSGELHCDSLRTARQLNVRDRNYFQRALVAEKAGVVVEPVFGRLTNVAVLQIVHPVRADGGALRYMLVASLNLKEFAQLNLDQARASARELLLVDHQGTVLASSTVASNARAPGSSIAGTPLMALAQLRANGGTGEVQLEGNGTQIWAVAADRSPRATGLYVMLGISRDDLVAASTQRLRQDSVILAVVALLLLAGVWMLAEGGIRRQVGRIITMVQSLGNGDLAARIQPPYPRGELGGLMSALNSTAASLQAQREAIDELGLQLRQAQKLEALGTLAGGIAHDFNNILAAILGNLSLAHEEALSGQPTQRSLEQIRRAALRARELVQGIQAFSRADAPALSVQLLQPIVEEVLALVRVALPPGASLHTEVAVQPMHVLADATQLHQVLLNLCTNAWQALEGRAGVITVGLARVEFDADSALKPAELAPGPHAHLWVRDTGSGIDDAVRQRIFEPFFTTKGVNGGTGLGLSVVHGIVLAHHGAIVVRSRSGEGSTFDVYLPLHAAPVRSDAAVASAPGDAARVRGQGQHVMYVDDDPVMGLLVERLIERAGYRASCHSSARAALQALQERPADYDLVVTDFNMPEISGLELSRQLATLRPELPVLIMSGYVFDEMPAQARRAGVREVIRKQHVTDELIPAIARALAGTSRRA
jgi:signal transduction histidine kinase/ActR/RegA family two-component response regulator